MLYMYCIYMYIYSVWIQAHDLHDTNAMLCQLSYTVYMYEPLLEAGQEH